MAWNIFGKDTTPEQLPAELRADPRRNEARTRGLRSPHHCRARFRSKSCPPSCSRSPKRKKVVSELQARVKSLERLVPCSRRSTNKPKTFRKRSGATETQLTQNSENAKELRVEIDELRGVLEAGARAEE